MHHREERRLDGGTGGTGGTRPRLVWDAVAGREWRVWATDCRAVPGARSDECLIFDGGTTVRRVWSPPPDWATLSDRELLALVEPRD